MSQETRIQIIGDSWAEFIWEFPSFVWKFAPFLGALLPKSNPLQTALNEAGFSRCLATGHTTAVGGTRSYQWLEPQNLQKITTALNAKPSIDIVHLSIGGNDFLECATLNQPIPIEKILSNVSQVVDHILGVRENLRICFASYTYAYVKPAFIGSIEDMNKMIFALEAAIGAMLAEKYGKSGRVMFVNNMGLLPNPPSPHDFFDKVFHLTFNNYKRLAHNCIEECYKKWL